MASSSAAAAAAAVSKSAPFSTVASDWTQFEELSNLYPNPNSKPNQAWGSSGNYDLVESLMKSNQGRISGNIYAGYGSEEAELMRRISVVDPTRSVQRTMSSSLALAEGYRSASTSCLLRSSSFPQHEQQLCSSSSNSSSRAAETKALPFKNNGVELSDEDQQSSIQQQMTMNNGKNAMQQPKNNSNTRKRARADQNSNPKAMETPPDVVHVRARRGQATDSHSLAERVRREKISQRMKVLQEIVPGCHKVLGKAMMLDEIINYVKSLQKQVEFLSMKLATANQVGIDSMIMNKDCAFVNENMVSFPSHGDVAYVNVPNELSSTCQQLRPEVLMTSLIQ